MKASRLAVLVGLLSSLALLGCHEPVLTSRPEDEANEALATLASAGIEARKLESGRGSFSVTVPPRELEPAVTVLAVAGLPRSEEPGLADLFPDSGLVSSPTEDRARYNLGLAGELGSSLRRLPGVRDARVHLGLPRERARRLDRTPADPAKASVLLIVEPASAGSPSLQIEPIRELVAGAVTGLQREAVSVVITESKPLPAIERPGDGQPRPVMLATGASAAVAGLALSCLFVIRRKPRLEEVDQ